MLGPARTDIPITDGLDTNRRPENQEIITLIQIRRRGRALREQNRDVTEAVAVDVNADTIDYEAKWAPMEVVIALFIFVTCAFSMTRLCRAKEDQYAPVTRAISEEDLVAPEEDVERGPTLEDKRRMLD